MTPPILQTEDLFQKQKKRQYFRTALLFVPLIKIVVANQTQFSRQICREYSPFISKIECGHYVAQILMWISLSQSVCFKRPWRDAITGYFCQIGLLQSPHWCIP